MKTLEHWMGLIRYELNSDQTSAETDMAIRQIVQNIQDDAAKGDGSTEAKMLLEYHEQQKEWWRTNHNDPHDIGTALYTMHCELVNIYSAIVSGDAKRNWEHNQKVKP